MDIETFVREAVSQITRGAAAGATQGAVEVFPLKSVRSRAEERRADKWSEPMNIDFDIAVVVTDESESHRDGKLRVLSIGSGEKGSSIASRTEMSSRIKFSLPISVRPDFVASKPND